MAVLGQEDFAGTQFVRIDTAGVDEEVGRTRMRSPSGVAYDGATGELYVNDKGNDRILVFDARPEALETGMVGLNQGVVSNPAAPFGGVKRSGFGRKGGRQGLEEYLDTKYIALPAP
ncbi:MAG: aldehyde dehydrogenase family protein [Solirubrobacterales bacterium]|nr:aldehyde dehydrogenase family protein [Solirubrobacterales bacterium]